MWEAITSAWSQAVVHAMPSRQAPLGTLVAGPPDWRNSEGAVRIILDRLGWGHGRRRVLLVGDSDSSSLEEEQAAPTPPSLSVRAGTRLLLGPVQAHRRRLARIRFVIGAFSA